MIERDGAYIPGRRVIAPEGRKLCSTVNQGLMMGGSGSAGNTSRVLGMRFDADFTDLAGNVFTATAGSPFVDTFNKFGGGSMCNARGAISCPATPTLALNDLFTISFWINLPNSYQGGTANGIIDLSSGGQARKIYWSDYNSYSFTLRVETNTHNSSVLLFKGDWHFIVIQRSSEAGFYPLRLFANGVMFSSVQNSGASSMGSVPCVIGGAQLFNIDDLSIITDSSGYGDGGFAVPTSPFVA